MFAESPRMFKGEPARARPADGARSPPAVTGGGVGTSGHRRGQLRATCAGRPGALVGKSPGQSAVRGGDRQRGVVALPLGRVGSPSAGEQRAGARERVAGASEGLGGWGRPFLDWGRCSESARVPSLRRDPRLWWNLVRPPLPGSLPSSVSGRLVVVGSTCGWPRPHQARCRAKKPSILW